MPGLPNASRPSGAQTAVMVLGGLSALALVGASLADFGDPRANARLESQQLVRTQVAEIRLAWDSVRDKEAPPEAAGNLLRLPIGSQGASASPEEAVEIDAGSAGASTASIPPDPLTRVYFDLGRASLARGEAELALEAFKGGLEIATSETAGYAEALFSAIRAAGALGRADEVLALREALAVAAPSRNAFTVDGTSALLLAALAPPLDPALAHRVLRESASALPPPADRITIEGSTLTLTPDPWWAAIETRLEGEGPTHDWASALRKEERLAGAVRAYLDNARIDSSDRWQIAEVDGEWIIHRLIASGLRDVAALDVDSFLADLLTLSSSEPRSETLQAQWSWGASVLPGSAALGGTPLFFLISPVDLEIRAQSDIRRIRLLRAAFASLGLLVLLATLFSARAMARARRLNELRSTFVASVSHDLRTPTQAILLLAQTLEQDLVEAPESRSRYHTQIRREAQRLRRLVEDLLDGARIDRGDGARVERREVATEAFFQELSTSMHERASAAGAELAVELSPNALPKSLYVDSDGLHRAIWNLFENALRYGRRDGAPADVHMLVRAVGTHLEVTISDDGPGIPKADAENVFKPFRRLADAKRAKESQGKLASDTGTGLGLAIVRAICRAHGGTVELRAPAGARRGASFAIVLPVAPPTEEELI